MKSLAIRLAALAMAALLCITPFAELHAQQPAPAVVVSIGNTDELLADINYLINAANAPQLGIFTVMAGGYAQLLDKSKPAGLYVSMEEGAPPKALGFLPITDLNTALNQLPPQLTPAQDVGNGVKQLGQEQKVFIKAQGPWVFVSDNAQNLTNLPQDPSSILGDLPEQYDIAFRINVRNIPESSREQAVQQLRSGFQSSFEQQLQQGDQSDADRELAQKLSGNSMQQFVAMIEETEQFTVGFEIDREAENLFVDMSVTAVEGTTLAEQMELAKETTTDFVGFQMDDAAVTLAFNSRIPQQDIEQAQLLITAVREKALQELEKDPELKTAEQRAAAKEVVSQLLDVATKTIQSGKLDGGAVMLMDPQAIRVAMGGYVADGEALESALKDLVELAQNEPDFPEVQFDAETHAGVAFHTLSAPIPQDEEDAQQLFGQQLDVTVGTGPQSVYMAFGKNNGELLKQVIDQSMSAAGQASPPLTLKIAVGQIIQVAAAVQEQDQNLQQAAAAAKDVAGSDHISLSAEGIERGLRYRLEVEGGVLTLIGRAMAQQQPGPGAPRSRAR